MRPGLDRPVYDDHLFALGAHRNNLDRLADELLDAPHVALRVLRQVFEASRFRARRVPAGMLFEDRLGAVEGVDAGGWRVDLLAVDFVSNADLDGRELVQHVETRQGDRRHAVNRGAISRGNGVEPTSTSRASRSGADLGPRA